MDRYEIRVRGRLSPALLARFEGLEAKVEPVETLIHGPVADQAALHGMIHLVDALGLELLEVKRLPASGAANGASQQSDDHRNEEQR
jgi:hypothetical protein